MKNIRFGVFETNSSSVHTLIICNDKEYNDLVNGKMLISCDYDKLISIKDAIEEYNKIGKKEIEITGDTDIETALKLLEEYEIATTYENYGDGYEFYDESYTTNNGEVIHAFGYYGDNY